MWESAIEEIPLLHLKAKSFTNRWNSDPSTTKSSFGFSTIPNLNPGRSKLVVSDLKIPSESSSRYRVACGCRRGLNVRCGTDGMKAEWDLTIAFGLCAIAVVTWNSPNPLIQKGKGSIHKEVAVIQKSCSFQMEREQKADFYTRCLQRKDESGWFRTWC
jgi:hypothetical protein